jgi:hypothetical protein
MSQFYSNTGKARHTRLLFSLFVIMLPLCLTIPAAADTILLDDFSQSMTATNPTGNNFFFDDLGSTPTEYELNLYPNGSVSWTDTGSGIFGGTRTVTMAKGSTGSSPTSAKIYSGTLQISHPTSDGPLSITLDYQNAPATMFTGVDWFVVNMQELDDVAVNSVFPTVRLYSSASVFKEKIFTTPLALGSNILTLSSLFSELGTRNVTRVTVSMEAQTGADFKINSLAFTPTPEPGAIAASLLAAVLCGIRLHKRQRAPRERSCKQTESTATLCQNQIVGLANSGIPA